MQFVIWNRATFSGIFVCRLRDNECLSCKEILTWSLAYPATEKCWGRSCEWRQIVIWSLPALRRVQNFLKAMTQVCVHSEMILHRRNTQTSPTYRIVFQRNLTFHPINSETRENIFLPSLMTKNNKRSFHLIFHFLWAFLVRNWSEKHMTSGDKNWSLFLSLLISHTTKAWYIF